MRYTPHFIVVRAAHNTNHATFRAATKPWAAWATCTNTSGPLHAAKTAARKAGYEGFTIELVPKTREDWAAATNGYLSARTVSAITHIYRLIAP